jgi:hypothetical protein
MIDKVFHINDTIMKANRKGMDVFPITVKEVPVWLRRQSYVFINISICNHYRDSCTHCLICLAPGIIFGNMVA